MTLTEYFEKHFKPLEVFPQDFNEVIGFVYIYIQGAVRDNCDTLTLTSTDFICSKEGQVVDSFYIGNINPDISFRDALKLIVERDEVIRQHLELVEDSQEKITYRLN
ncbi:MAG TPA: hypothetical protein VH186_37595 [Chloroflexia bacterium]|nr:hypothetical protein [Chloroflexia bacterium]